MLPFARALLRYRCRSEEAPLILNCTLPAGDTPAESCVSVRCVPRVAGERPARVIAAVASLERSSARSESESSARPAVHCLARTLRCAHPWLDSGAVYLDAAR